MKTFEEALAMVYRDAPVDSAAAIAQAEKEVLEFSARFREFANDARGSAALDKGMRVWKMMCEERVEFAVDNGLFTAFMTGLIVGMEMEKHE